MFRYILRRLLIAMPTMFVVALFVFAVSKCAPGDPVEDIFGANPRAMSNPEKNGVVYQGKAAQLGLDKPAFYFTLKPAAYPDTLWRIYPLDRRERLDKLIAQTGNWPATRAYDAALNHALDQLDLMPDTIPVKAFLNKSLISLSGVDQLGGIREPVLVADSLANTIRDLRPELAAATKALKLAAETLQQQLQPWELYRPDFHWYGFNNQFHHWLGGFLTGNWGYSKSKKPVWVEVKPALFASMTVNVISLALAYLIAIPLGVAMARRRGKAFDRWGKRSLFFLNAMPVFWMGALLAILLTSPVFGKPLLASPYLDVSDGWMEGSESFIAWFFLKAHKFVLPILVLTLYALAVIAMQMRGGILENLKQDYIRTARAKGVSENGIHWRHAFRNALFPIITIFGSLFPALFTGSLVVETMFNFPGIGLKTQNAFTAHDLPTLSFILLSAALLTILGNLVADILYAWADPRVRFSRE